MPDQDTWNIFSKIKGNLANINQNNIIESILRLRELSVTRSGVKVLEKVSFDITKGEFVGLVGPNGGGKTTLLLTILGVLKPSSGSVLVYGQKPASSQNLGKVAWVPQTGANLPRHIHITVRELISLGTINRSNFLLGTGRFRTGRVNKAIEMVGLEDIADVDVSRLSGGQLQRAVIGRALASESNFIVLDEPLVGVDRDAKNSILRLLDDLCHDHGKTILMVSHDLAAISQTTHRIIYLEGEVQFDGPSSKMPDLNELASIRGIQNPHAMKSRRPPIVHIKRE